MTVQRYKKKHLFIIISAIIVVIGITAFVLGYGLSDGWDAVAAWFGSKYAGALYICLGLYGVLVAWILINDRIKRL